MGNADAFPSTSFGWFLPSPVSLLARRNMPLSGLLNAERCECLWRDLALLLFVGERFGKLPEDNSSSAGVSTSSETMSSFIMSSWVPCLTVVLHISFIKIMSFFYLRPQTIVFKL